MASGLLTGAMTRSRIANLPADDWRKQHPDFREPLLSRNLELVKMLRVIGARHGCNPAEVSIAWVLHNPAVTGAITGAARHPGQIKDLIGGAQFHLSEDEYAQIDRWAANQAA